MSGESRLVEPLSLSQIVATATVMAVVMAAIAELSGSLSFLTPGLPGIGLILFALTVIMPLVLGRSLLGPRGRPLVTQLLGLGGGVAGVLLGYGVFIVLPSLIAIPYALAAGGAVFTLAWIVIKGRDAGIPVRRTLGVYLAALGVLGVCWFYLSDLETRLGEISFGAGEVAESQGLFGEDLMSTDPEGISSIRDLPLAGSVPFALGAALVMSQAGRRRDLSNKGFESDSRGQ